MLAGRVFGGEVFLVSVAIKGKLIVVFILCLCNLLEEMVRKNRDIRWFCRDVVNIFVIVKLFC